MSISHYISPSFNHHPSTDHIKRHPSTITQPSPVLSITSPSKKHQRTISTTMRRTIRKTILNHSNHDSNPTIHHSNHDSTDSTPTKPSSQPLQFTIISPSITHPPCHGAVSRTCCWAWTARPHRAVASPRLALRRRRPAARGRFRQCIRPRAREVAGGGQGWFRYA